MEPIDILDFRDRVLAGARERFPTWTFTPIASPVDGQPAITFSSRDAGMHQAEHIANVEGFYRRYLFSGRVEEGIEAAILAFGTSRNDLSRFRYLETWENAREHAMVRLDRQMAKSYQQGIPRVALPWQGNLVITLILDFPDIMMSVSREMLGRWGITAEDFAAIGFARTREALTRTTPDHQELVIPGATIRYWMDDLVGYCATRALWPDLALPAVPTGRQQAIIAAPDAAMCIGLLVENPHDIAAQMAVVTLVQLMSDRIDAPNRVMLPNMAFVMPDGTYLYHDSGVEDDAVTDEDTLTAAGGTRLGGDADASA